MGRLFVFVCGVSLPMFLLGIVCGLWTKRLWRSLVIGLLVGVCFAVAFMNLGLPSMWYSFMFVATPSALGSLTGHEIGSQSPYRNRAVLSLFLCAFAAIIFIWVLESSASRRANYPRADCLSNLKQIGLALAMYSDNYQGHLPPEPGVKGLNRLHVYIANPTKIFHCPKDTIHRVAKI